MCNRVPYLEPIPRMTKEEQKFCNLGKNVKVYHVTRIVTEDAFICLERDAYAQFIFNIERDTALSLFEDLYKKGVFRSEISGEKEKEIRISLPLVTMDIETENLIDRDARQTRQLMEASKREKEYRRLLCQAKIYLTTAIHLEKCLKESSNEINFSKLSAEIQKKLEGVT